MDTSGSNVKVAYQPSRHESGGASPTLPLYRITDCEFMHISHIFEKFHYKGSHMGGGISLCLALMDGWNVVGGAVVGRPRHDKKYAGSLEIRRMACIDEAPKNTESYFLSKIIWWLRKNTDAEYVLSYADQSVGHKGTIYKAANFEKIGETSPSLHVFWNGKRYHPRSLTIDRDYSYKMREAVKTGEAVVEKGLPKSIYIYKLRGFSGNQRKALGGEQVAEKSKSLRHDAVSPPPTLF